jgi:3-(3-hydroxy-phenyl)propionate hydroxylase
MAEAWPIVISGAGPAGLSCALVLADAGVPVTVCEAEPALALDLRAGTYHPPTLEMMAPYGVPEGMMAEGAIQVRQWQIRDREAGVLAEFDLGLLANDTPYPYRLHLEQHKLTPILLDRLRAYPHFAIEFGTRVVAARQNGNGVDVLVERQGQRRIVRGSYLVGADGTHSPVRESMGVKFEGFTWDEGFLIVSTTYDFEPHGFAKAAYIADPTEWVMLFKVPGFNPPALWRIALPTDPKEPREQTMDAGVVQARLQGFLARSAPYDIVHRNAYRVHQRVATAYHSGRIAIAGDAAHVNNPLGGMGLNGSVHDAVNLAGKLAAMWRGEAGPEALELYDRQRRDPQIEYVQRLTIENKRFVTARDAADRRKRQDEIRRIGADKALAYDYLLNSSMIAMVRKANAIT